MITQDKWEWFGNVGHFICGRWCRFHLCTKVGKYLISTVGEYVHPRHSKGSELAEIKWLQKNWPGEDIRYQKKYETMVFVAGERCAIKGCDCGLPSIGGEELDMMGYNTAGEATRGHMELCLKWSRR
jgi:hypothetical protein